MNERIIRCGFSSTLSFILIRVESSCKFVAINNAEDTAVEADVLTNTDVFPVVAVNTVHFRHEVSLKEDTLWNARVLNFRLLEVDSVILKVVVESALANAVILVSAFSHRLLEVAREVKHLAVILEPFGSYAWNGIVDLLGALGVLESGSTLALHAFK